MWRDGELHVSLAKDMEGISVGIKPEEVGCERERGGVGGDKACSVIQRLC